MARNYFGNSFGKTSQSFGGGKNVWHEVKAAYPVGGLVDLTNYSAGDIIPAGSVALFNQADKEVIIVPLFSATSTYAVGDYVMYGGALYICDTAVSTAGAWDAEDWTIQTATTLASEGLSVGLTHNDIYVDAAAVDTGGAITVSPIYAGEVYASRLDVAIGVAFLALVPQIVPIYEE